MFFLLYLVFTLGLVVTFIWQLPAPLHTKIGFILLGESAAALLGVGVFWGYTELRRIYREVIDSAASNCLVWRHPEHTPNGLPTLELASYPSREALENKSHRLQVLLAKRHFRAGGLRKEILRLDKLIKDTVPISGADWFYKYYWFMAEKRLKWMYEVKQDDGTFVLAPYLPDMEMNLEYPTTGQLAAALDWRAAKRRLRHKKALADKLATGAIIAMPLIGLLALMFLLDMLQQNKMGGG